jgi:hypothetical protein
MDSHRSPASRGPRRLIAPTATALLVAAGAIVAPAGPAAVVHAGSVIAVTTTEQKIGGPGGCSLQEAILAANHDSSSFTAPGNDAVVINTACAAGNGDDIIVLAPGTYPMTNVVDDADNEMGATATPKITSPMIIEGRGALLMRFSLAPMRAFAVGEGGSLDLREVHVQGFAARGGNGARGGGGGMGAGGAIFVHGGTLLVQWSTFEGNTATGGNGSTGNQFDGAGGGGGGIGGSGGLPEAQAHGGGGGGSRGNGGDSIYLYGGGGGGTVGDAPPYGVGGYRCGGAGGYSNALIPFTEEDGHDGCAGGGGGGGAARDSSPGGSLLTQSGTGGAGGYGGGGGGGGWDLGDGGQGGFGGGGGSGPAFNIPGDWFGAGGGDGGFGGGGGAGPGGDVFGEPGDGGTFGGNARDVAGGGGAGLGGAIFGHGADIEIRNSTFTGNAAVRGVGGVGGGDTGQNGADAGGAIFTVAGSLTIRNSTIAGNESTGDGAGVVVYRPTTGDTTTLRMYNTIVANNTGHDECFVLGGVDRNGSNNLITPHPLDDNRTECLGITLTGDPMLGPLQLNWPGRTPTMALWPGSPAIDAGGLLDATPDDQRGVARPQMVTADIGAYEYAPGLDTTPPVAAPTTAPPANANGWNNTAVTVTWNWTDEANGSGIDPRSCTTATTPTFEGVVTVHAFCWDLAGNEGEGIVIVHVDVTAPTVTCAATPTFTIDAATASVSATVTDRHSGPEASTVSSPVSAADLASPGTKSVNVTGADLAGNTTTVSCPYVVKYGFGGFQEPIPQSSYKRGSMVPVRFQLKNAAGVVLPDSVAQALISPTCRVRMTFDGVDQGCFRYDASTDKFVVELKTTKSVAVGQHTVGVVITAADGSVVNSETTTVVIR